MISLEINQQIAVIVREDGGRLLALLTSQLRNIELAQDCLQEAYASVLRHWPRGVPANPAAWVLQTHVHADHLSGAPYIMLKTAAKVVISEHICKVQQMCRPIFNALDVSGEGAEFDVLVKDGDRFRIGSFDVEVIATPGHTPACVSFKIADAVFVGDTLFMPDYGTARADFPGGDARTLYRSIQKILSLPPKTRLFMCHDYLPPQGCTAHQGQSTFADEKARNIHANASISADQFVALREARDKTLTAPNLLLPSIQVNMRAGKMPPADKNGVHYIRVPVSLPSGL